MLETFFGSKIISGTRSVRHSSAIRNFLGDDSLEKFVKKAIISKEDTSAESLIFRLHIFVVSRYRFVRYFCMLHDCGRGTRNWRFPRRK